jgi:hypothetical protein
VSKTGFPAGFLTSEFAVGNGNSGAHGAEFDYYEAAGNFKVQQIA